MNAIHMNAIVTLSANELTIEGEAAELIKALEAVPKDDLPLKLVFDSSVEIAQFLMEAGFKVEIAEREDAEDRERRTIRKVRMPRVTYTAEQIEEVIAWVNSSRPEFGRKTIPMAVEKFGVSGGLVRKWLKGGGDEA